MDPTQYAWEASSCPEKGGDMEPPVDMHPRAIGRGTSTRGVPYVEVEDRYGRRQRFYDEEILRQLDCGDLPRRLQSAVRQPDQPRPQGCVKVVSRGEWGRLRPTRRCGWRD